MDTWVWIVLAIVVVVLIGVAIWAATTKRRTTGLRDQFGPEYDRTIGAVRQLLRGLDAADQHAVLGGTAAEVYRL